MPIMMRCADVAMKSEDMVLRLSLLRCHFTLTDCLFIQHSLRYLVLARVKTVKYLQCTNKRIMFYVRHTTCTNYDIAEHGRSAGASGQRGRPVYLTRPRA